MSKQIVPTYSVKPTQQESSAAAFRRKATAVAFGDYLEILTHAYNASSSSTSKTPQVYPLFSDKHINISIEEYAKRLGQFLYCSPFCFSVAAVLADRLYRHHPHLFTKPHLHRVMAALLIVAIKTTDDQHFDNRYFSECVGLSIEETNSMELHILKLLDFRVFVSDIESSQAEEVLKKFCKLRLLTPQQDNSSNKQGHRESMESTQTQRCTKENRNKRI